MAKAGEAIDHRAAESMKHKRQQTEDRPPEITEGDLLAYLAKANRPKSIREMASALGLRHWGRRALPKLLGRLKRRGEVEEEHGRYRLTGHRPAPTASQRAAQHNVQRAEPSASQTPEARAHDAARPAKQDPNLIAGRLVAHRDGYGFVVPDRPVKGMDGDLFISPDSMGDAMHGDRVEARLTRRHSDGRFEGRIEKITARAHPTVVGLFRYGPHGNVVLPYEIRLAHEIIIPPGAELTPALQEKLQQSEGELPRAAKHLRLPELDGAVVNVEITRYPRGGVAPAGRVVEILGRPGEMGVDVEIIIRKHHLPHRFAPEVLAQAREISQQVSEEDLRGRRDFRDLPIVTVDGETAKDFDDAVYVAARPGGYELQIHIADVAHYVRRASELDREARLRGTSVYFPNRAVPMLPEELSNGICSLNPRVDRLVMSAILQLDKTGKVLEAEFTPGVIRSVERMTYTNVHKVLEGDPQMEERYAPLVAGFQRMKELALALNARRAARGSIDFDLPEAIIEFDDAGRMMGVVRSVRNIAHRIIEEFMLAANEAVAAYLERRVISSLHRVHEKPDPKKVLEFEELARAFGYSLGVEDLSERRIAVRHGHVRPAGRERHGRTRTMEVALPGADFDIRPQHYQRLTQKLAGKPEERILSYLMLRSLKQARYAAEPLGHFALAADEYTHFTSPIRRYPDLIVHRILKWALENPSAAKGPYRPAELEEIAVETSEAERRAETAERELMAWKTAQYMESHLGEEYDALIISVQKFGFFVELFEVFVEGLVAIDRLEETLGQRFQYRESDHAIVSQSYRARKGRDSRREFRLGDRVRVRAERIDPFRHRVEFSLVEPSPSRS
ncbi:MAG TPA: RNB domain-containing ribonuclease [Candidatus Limnocylindrales bacterium]|nr:RNB domain-containing ribonuclease [Candidatus Limnocylindrales bacterium]